MTKEDVIKIISDTTVETVVGNPELLEVNLKKLTEIVSEQKKSDSNPDEQLVGQALSDLLQTVITMSTINTLASLGKFGIFPVELSKAE